MNNLVITVLQLFVLLGYNGYDIVDNFSSACGCCIISLIQTYFKSL